MAAITEFNLLESPLQGTNLIEASAGTGKTYTIAALYLRLLLERRLSVDQILVVTFTEAATGELRQRVRDRIRDAAQALQAGGSDDPFLHALATAHGDSELALRWLENAIRDFDQAAIFTIHGFCQRVLHESAFESGALFDTELVAEQQQLIREIVEDFWRKHFYRASPLFYNYAVSRNLNPDKLLTLLGNKTGQPFLKIIPADEMPDTAGAEAKFSGLFSELCAAWSKARCDVEGIFSDFCGFSKTHYKTEKAADWLQAMDAYFAAGVDTPVLFADFEKFTAAKICKGTKKGHIPPDHSFFHLCEGFKAAQEELACLFEKRLVALKAALFAFARDELPRRKQEKNIHSFDDLLLNLHSALHQEGGSELAAAVKAKFSAALIDEFQDTDPVQYAIFKKIFDGEGSTLFLIGDPKQAIYGFRGADIFTYMEAASQAKSRYTLGKNWRSEPALIEAVNALFARGARPFVYDLIPFLPVASGKGADHEEALTLDGRSEPPLQLWLADAGKLGRAGKPITKEDARALLPRAVAGEISRLLARAAEGRASVAGRALQAGDIAVLVRRNREARLVQKALFHLQIPSVVYSSENLFDSAEAGEMERLLVAIVEPGNESLLKAALATETIGLKGEQLDQMQREDEAGWEGWLIRFREYHDLWRSGGFMRAFRKLLLDHRALERLMSLPDGERRITNLLHLSEVLQQNAAEKKLSMTGVLKWLTDQRDPATLRLEEHQLRLESDENAVKLVTVHKSKGLEYPIVLCPFTWDGSKIKKPEEGLSFHDEADGLKPVLDLGSLQLSANRALAEKELLAENVRLLYVALTRAKNRSYLVWGRFSEADTSAPAHVLHGPEAEPDKNPVEALAEKCKAMSDQDLRVELGKIAEAAGGALEVVPLPEEAGSVYKPVEDEAASLRCREFSGAIERRWRISSFSSLVSGQPYRAELADYDDLKPAEGVEEGSEEPRPQPEALNIFAFPKGAAAGILLHEIFEDLDFGRDGASGFEGLIARKLEEHGFEAKWLETLCTMFRNVLSANLDPSRPDFTLSRIGRGVAELQFYFPLQRISSGELTEIFHRHSRFSSPRGWGETVGRLSFSPVRGFMKGFIDLVFEYQGRFYLVDWKSNFLGPRIEDYRAEALQQVMINEMYVLQYHIYTLALHQYLRLRIPDYAYDTHFGGVYYLFLRGIDPKSGPAYGIFRDRPPGELIEALSQRLIGTAT